MRMMYTVRLKKVRRLSPAFTYVQSPQLMLWMHFMTLPQISHHEEMATVRRRLGDEFGLAEDPDVLYGLAVEMFAEMRYAECFKVTEK